MQEAALQRVDRLERAGFVLDQCVHRLVAQRPCLFRRGARQVITDRQDAFAHPLIKHMLVFDLAVIPVLPAIVSLLDTLAFGHAKGLFERGLQVGPEHLGHIATDQRGGGPATGQQHAFCIDHKHIAVLVDELALTAEGGERLVTLLVVVRQGFFQQGLGGLGIRFLCRGGMHLAATQQQQPGESEQSLHLPVPRSCWCAKSVDGWRQIRRVWSAGICRPG